jgi:hypothetical protein
MDSPSSSPLPSPSSASGTSPELPADPALPTVDAVDSLSTQSESDAPALKPLTAPCLNCGHEASLKFCPACGQRTGNIHLKFSTLLLQMVDAYLNVDGTLFRTLKTLFLNPGKLTTEYWQGRQVRFLRPFNLYVVSSFLFFAVLVVTNKGNDTSKDDNAKLAKRQMKLASRTMAEEGKRQAAAALSKAAEARQTRGAADKTKANPFAGEAATAAAVETAVQERIRAAERGLEETAASLGGNSNGQADESDDEDEQDSNDAKAISPTDGPSISVNDGPPVQVLEQLAGMTKRQKERLELKHPEGISTYLSNSVAESFPKAMFVLLPFCALFLKLLYFRRDRLLSEHFVFSLHAHAFAFLTFTFSSLSPSDWLSTLAHLFFVAHTLIAMKVVYQQSWLKTLIKSGILATIYGGLIVASIALVASNAFLNG